jgi:hypothetical protein
MGHSLDRFNFARSQIGPHEQTLAASLAFKVGGSKYITVSDLAEMLNTNEKN